jgi:hypothetical protein
VPKRLGPVLEGLSRKSIRLLEKDGVLDTLAEGGELAVTGPAVLLGASGTLGRLAFSIEPENRLHVGYAVAERAEGPWRRAGGEFEPFSMRAYGYYVRYLKRRPLVR